MKKLYSLLLVALVASPLAKSFSQSANDTIVVQAFTYGSSQDSTIVFPSDTIRFEKILMRYKLRCPYTVQCGEWDYLTYTYAYKPTGEWDSVMHIEPSYVINGASPDSFPYSNTPTSNYHTHFDKHIVYDSIISFDSTIVGNGLLTSNAPFSADYRAARSQYIWRASELTAAGLQPGNISGIRFNFTGTYGNIKNLAIKMKASALDSITPDNYEHTGMTLVYRSNTDFTLTGWQTLLFNKSFVWDGISNIVIEVRFTDPLPDGNMDVASDDAGYAAGMTVATNDRNLFFNGSDYLTVPANGFANIDSFVTVMFWAYGNPDYQPQNQSIFEGVDSTGHRILNCHLPWSNGSIYWDAGIDASNSYDRINKVASTSSEYEGKWNHWAFTKNVVTGRMRIYLNGNLFFMGVGKFKHMNGITQFKIGSAANGLSNYDGNVDEFSIWNAELSDTTIMQWMQKDISASHPQYANLLYYYQFNENSATVAVDASPNGYDATLFGTPQSIQNRGFALHRNLTATTIRPQVTFEQGTYISHLDSTLVITTTPTNAVSVVLYNDFLNPTVPTDTLLVYPATYSYTYDSVGVAIDSTLDTDGTLYLTNTTWYEPPFEKTIRYEIGRFITPYGNGLSLGNGFTWWYDVSDYRTILHDSLRIVSGNWQELHDLQFLFIKGIPPRDPISVTNTWNGSFYMRASDSIETKNLYEKKIEMNPAASTYKFRMRPSGHGADNQNCAEFCVKTHSLKVNGVTQFSRDVWKEDCGINPLYPQGGTWVYQRANWCPGDDVPTFDYELTPWVNPGDSTMLDYDITQYISVGGSPANYVIESQVVAYGPINHAIDAAVDQIKSPSLEDIYKRMNPICDNPVITIKNNGSTPLTSATINFGFEGGTMATYNWTGNLAFDNSVDVTLPGLVWNGTGNRFLAVVTNPNGALDEYHHNDSMYSSFSIPASFPNYVVLEFKTNAQASQNSYILSDVAGNTIVSRQNLANNTTYLDTVNLPNGCYTFRLLDTIVASGYGEDGLTWWANPAQGSGYMRIKDAATGALLSAYSSDFGREIYQQFSCGLVLNVDNKTDLSDVSLYPNPSRGLFNLSMNFSKSQDVVVKIYDVTGKLIYTRNESSVVDKNLMLDLQSAPSGMYHATIQFNNGVINKRFVIEK